jgi:hypothetical protein
MERKILVTIEVSNNEESLALALQNAKEAVALFGLKIIDCKQITNTRTIYQNNALHLFFQQLADELNEKGFDMRAIIRQEVEIQWTGFTIKSHLWKPLQKALFNKKSTTKLAKNYEIDVVYDNLNRILVERTKGEVSIPPFPSFDSMLDKNVEV